MTRHPLAGLLITGLLIMVLLAAGCSQAPPPLLPVAGLAAWEVPAAAYGTQRLYRARYDGPDGEGSFNLTLRLAAPERFQAAAVHSLGKKLWSLDVAAGRALWLDHRAEAYCLLAETLELGGGRLLPLPVGAFPALLLGRLPEAPAAPVRRAGSELTVPGADGRTWIARVDDGRVRRWLLEEAGRPTVWWRFEDGEALLSDRERGVQLAWREVVAEPLAAEPERLEPPPSYRLADCARLELAPGDDLTPPPPPP